MGSGEMNRWLLIGAYAAFSIINARAAETEHLWKAVPQHRNVFVDLKSIHRVAVVPARDAYHLPSADTQADIKVSGHISKMTGFYCDQPGIELGDMHFGEFDGDKKHAFGVIPMADVRAVVCSPSKSSN
jgi:hypothetical protein